MKGSLCILTLLAVVSAPLAVARSQESGVRSQEPGASSQSLLSEAARRVDAEVSLAADVRYRVDAFGHQLLGTGNYLQSGPPSARQLRLDLRMKVGDKPATHQEIRGLDYYWVRRDVPPSPPTLGRVDLVLLRRALRGADAAAPDDALPRGAWIMLGGLPRLLSSLDRSFDFSAPRADEVQLAGSGESSQRLPIWILSGTWKPARLAALSGREGASHLPDQFPDRVEVVLDRTDRALPLFPYRITYYRSAKKDSDSSSSKELLSLELFNVRRVGPIDPREFQYQSGDQEILDHTSAYIQQLGGDSKRR